MALDGMKIIKIAAGGWHSAAISGNLAHCFGLHTKIHNSPCGSCQIMPHIMFVYLLICHAEFNDLYMFGWNESGQLAQATNLARPAECFSAVEKLLMACCTMQVLKAFFSACVRHMSI